MPLTRAAQPPLVLWALCTLRDWNNRPGRFPCATSGLVSVPGMSFTALISGSPTLSGLGVPPFPTLSQYSDFLRDGDFKTLQNLHRSSPKNPKRRLESSSLPGHHICLMGYQAAAPDQSWQQPQGVAAAPRAEALPLLSMCPLAWWPPSVLTMVSCRSERVP